MSPLLAFTHLFRSHVLSANHIPGMRDLPLIRSIPAFTNQPHPLPAQPRISSHQPPDLCSALVSHSSFLLRLPNWGKSLPNNAELHQKRISKLCLSFSFYIARLQWEMLKENKLKPWIHCVMQVGIQQIQPPPLTIMMFEVWQAYIWIPTVYLVAVCPEPQSPCL